MPKIIVTHMNPDLDVIASVWLLKRFGSPEWQEAEVKFVPAGKTYKDEKADSNPDIFHVDVGLGKLDHHQTGDENLCGATLVFDYLAENDLSLKNDEALKRLVEVVRDIDWAGYLRFPQPDHDRWSFFFFEEGIISGWQRKYRHKSDDHMEWGLIVLDGVYGDLQSKVEAEAVLKDKSIEFKTRWGKGVGAETEAFGFKSVALSKGYPIVVTKNSKSGSIRISGFEFGKIKPKVDLTEVWEILKHKDPNATWFLHSSKKLLLNGSRANPDMIPTSLSLKEVMEVLENC